MNTTQILRDDHRTALRIETACEFSAVRAGVQAVREWLAKTNLPAEALGDWELALIEAVNNAVKYADAPARKKPVFIEISSGQRDIEARVIDHTAGFAWPAEIKLPAEDAESGRGLYLMKSLTDEMIYLRHPAENVLVLRRARPASSKILPDAAQLQTQLADAEKALTDMTAELASSYESLVALFRYSAELGTQTDVKEFSARLLRDLMQLAEADCAVLRLVSADGKKLEPLQFLPGNGKFLPALELAGKNASIETAAARNRQDAWFSPKEPLDENDPLRVAIPVGNGVCHAFFIAGNLVGTATLGRLAADKPFMAAQVNLLHTFIDFLAIQIVNAKLLDERTVASVTRRELEIASEIQRSLLPATLPACPPFTLAAACENALQVGGDFYDAISANDGAALLVIADVMGKGVPAALFAAVLRSTIRSMPQLFSRPGGLLAAANRILFPDLSRVDMFATAKLAYLDARRGEIISASAGHCPLILARRDKSALAIAEDAGLPLGVEAQVNYAQTVTALPAGAAALLYTDGVNESRNAAGEMFGEKKLAEFFEAAARQAHDAESGRQILRGRLAAWRGLAPLTDDQTFIFIRNQS